VSDSRVLFGKTSNKGIFIHYCREKRMVIVFWEDCHKYRSLSFLIDRTNVLVFIFTTNPRLKILLLKRTQEKGGFWQPISGGIEEGEVPKDTVRREIIEETRLADYIRTLDLDYTFTHRTSKNGNLMNMRDFCYAVEVKEEVIVNLSNEHVEYKWCTIKETKQLLRWELGLIALQKLVDIIT
jgi:8-oxo-dGTP pyrophosphatase MutT (NUDIX family)